MHTPLFQIAAIAFAAMAAQWAGWKLNLPAIVFLLLSGFVLGPLFGIIEPKMLMGATLRPAVTAAVAIILFEGSLNLKFREIQNVKKAVWHIVLLGAPLGWAVIAAALHFVAGLSWPVAVTFGGMLVVTGPTVIIPMLRSARLNPRVSSILKWEGIINDPVGIIFAVLAYEYFKYYNLEGATGLAFYLKYFFILSAVAGGSYLCGRLSALVLERGYLPEYLKAPFLVTVVLVLYTVCNFALEESGLIAVAVLGVTLANIRVGSIDEIRRFKETITLLLVSGVFILLTADLDPHVLLDINARGALFIVLLLFVIRPLVVAISAIGTGMNWREVALIGWIAPRGVVCAAMAGVMQPLLVDAGYADGRALLPLAFGIVIVTVVAHSFTVKIWARRLKLSTEQSGGLIIVGAADWTLQLAETLVSKNIPVILADTHYNRLKAARLANIPTYYGELLSEEAEYNMELGRYGALLAATENSAYNALLCNAYAPVLGREHVYQLSAGDESHTAERKKVATGLQGRIFVQADQEHAAWWRSFFNGWRFKLTTTNTAGDGAGTLELSDGEIFVGTINKAGILSCRTVDYTPHIKDSDLVLLYAPGKQAVA